MPFSDVRRDWAVFAREGDVAIGAVRAVGPDRLTVYVEGFGDVSVAADQVAAVHDAKVVLYLERMPADVRAAIAHAHDREGDGQG